MPESFITDWTTILAVAAVGFAAVLGLFLASVGVFDSPNSPMPTFEVLENPHVESNCFMDPHKNTEVALALGGVR